MVLGDNFYILCWSLKGDSLDLQMVDLSPVCDLFSLLGRFSDTLKACALDVDIALMAGGDMAYIGEQGVNLSGGQRARLALTRAIYQGSDVCVLDVVFGAVDAKVARWILHRCYKCSLMDQKTRVCCTHNNQAISSADMIVVLDKGREMDRVFS